MVHPKLRFKREDGTNYPDWERKKLDDVGTVAMCKRVLKEQTSETGDVPFFKIGTIGSKADAYISRDLFEKLKTKFSYPKRGNVLLCAAGTIGRPVVFDGEDAYFQDSNIVWLKHDDSVMDSFLYQFYLQANWDKLEGGTIKRLYNGLLLDKDISVPCIDEQHKIADFLSTVDEVIAQSEAEVQNLEQQKKGVMQKIFSQEVRFRCEDGTSYPEWINTTFSETFSVLNNNTFSRDMLSEGGTVCNIHYGDILVKFGEVCDIQTADTPKVNANINTDKYDKLKDGDIVIADTAEDETVGKAIEIYGVGANEVVSGLHTMACRPNSKFAPKYLGYYINSPSYHNQLIPFMQGIKVTSIGRKNIADTVIYYPTCLEEQQKIADFLSAYDEAISGAKQELEKWKELKKGLLQQMFV